jgi:hypothetical protein
VARATGTDGKVIYQALKGRNIYVALSGLATIIMTCVLGRVPQAVKLSSLRGFFKQLLKD